MKIQICILFLFNIFQQIISARILAVLGTDLNSHFQILRAVIEHLTPYHNITFCYDQERIKYRNPEINSKHVDATSRFLQFNITAMLENACNVDSYDLYYTHVLTTNTSYFSEIYMKSDLAHILDGNETFDLFLTCGYGTEHFYQLAGKGTPVIQVLPSILKPWHNHALNNPYSWVNDFSFMVLDNTDTFWSRISKLVKNARIFYRYFFDFIPAINKAANDFFPAEAPRVEDVNKNTDLILVNTHNAMGYARPNVPSIVEIGGLHIKPEKPLPSDLEDFINGSGDDGVIYFSLGSLIQESAMSGEMRRAILNVFSKLKQRVLWKWVGNMSDIPPNVKLSKWFPQGDILAHKKIKLFILQGGMLSTQEALYHGVPLLVMPVIFDQYNNGYLAEVKGFGKSLPLCEFSERLFEKNIKEILYNSTYSKTVKKISKLMKHSKTILPETLRWWIDFVVKHKGSSTLKPLTHYHSWAVVPFDILLVFLIMFFFGIICTGYLLMCVYKKGLLSQKLYKSKTS